MCYCVVRSRESRREPRNRKRSRDVRAELDRNSHGHDEIDERQGVETDRPEEHQSEHAQQDHRDDHYDDDRRPQVKPEQYERHSEYGRHAQAEIENRLVYDRQVLLVKDVEYAGT